MTASILVLERDESLLLALADAAPGLGGELKPCAQTAQALTELSNGVRVLVAGPSCLTQSGVRFLQRAHRERPDLVTVLVADKAGPRLETRDLVRIGASDILFLPAAPRALRAALERAMDLAGRATRGRAPDATTGVALTVTSPTGGCGKTFFATNLAWALATAAGKKVAIVDLDLQFGEVVTALRLRPAYTISDLLRATGDEDGMRSQLREYLVRDASGVEVLAAPRDPAEADRIVSPDITRVVEAAKDVFDYVIVDTPAALSEPVLAAFDLSERLVVMATLDLPSVKNLGVFLSTLDRLKIPKEGISLVLNKAERDVGLSPAEVEALFPQGFTGILPYAKEVSRSLNMGRPVLEASGDTEVSRALATTLCRIVPDEHGLERVRSADDGERGRRLRLPRLRRTRRGA